MPARRCACRCAERVSAAVAAIQAMYAPPGHLDSQAPAAHYHDAVAEALHRAAGHLAVPVLQRRNG
jgi:hypothetical protein